MQTAGWDSENERRVVEREIERLRVGVDREPAISSWLGNTPGCFHRSMFDRRRIPTAFNDQVSARETLTNLTEPHSAAVMSIVPKVVESLPSNNRRSRLQRLFYIEHRVKRFELHLHPGGSDRGGLRALCQNPSDRFTPITYPILPYNRLIVR